MPTYEYACRGCGQHVEVVQSFRDDPLTTCGACGGALRKVFGAAGIIFKGSGYYVTDSRKQAASSEGGGGTDSGEKRSGAKEAKAPSSGESAKSAKSESSPSDAGSSAAKSA